MKIIAPWGSVTLAPAETFTGRYLQHAETLHGLWALPGGAVVGALELRALCRRQGWGLVDDEARAARRDIDSQWMAGRGISSLENRYCVPGLRA